MALMLTYGERANA